MDLSYFSFYLPRRRRYTKKFMDCLGPERKPAGMLFHHRPRCVSHGPLSFTKEPQIMRQGF